MKLKHVGLHSNRLPHNPVEKAFSKAWAKEMSAEWPNTNSTLDYLLATKVNIPCNEATQRDADVAATVIQWLGSPVGQIWLKDTQDKADKAMSSINNT